MQLKHITKQLWRFLQLTLLQQWFCCCQIGFGVLVSHNISKSIKEIFVSEEKKAVRKRTNSTWVTGDFFSSGTPTNEEMGRPSKKDITVGTDLIFNSDARYCSLSTSSLPRRTAPEVAKMNFHTKVEIDKMPTIEHSDVLL
jgi:hypothetical protein